MANTQEFLKSIQTNELFIKSISVHKMYQYHQFTDEDGNLLEGQKLQYEDKNANVSGAINFDEKSKRPVIYFFKNGIITDSDNIPAIQYPGHFEHWEKGQIVSVWGKGGTIREKWNNGVPVEIKED